MVNLEGILSVCGSAEATTRFAENYGAVDPFLKSPQTKVNQKKEEMSLVESYASDCSSDRYSAHHRHDCERMKR